MKLKILSVDQDSKKVIAEMSKEVADHLVGYAGYTGERALRENVIYCDNLQKDKTNLIHALKPYVQS